MMGKLPLKLLQDREGSTHEDVAQSIANDPLRRCSDFRALLSAATCKSHAGQLSTIGSSCAHRQLHWQGICRGRISEEASHHCAGHVCCDRSHGWPRAVRPPLPSVLVAAARWKLRRSFLARLRSPFLQIPQAPVEASTPVLSFLAASLDARHCEAATASAILLLKMAGTRIRIS